MILKPQIERGRTNADGRARISIHFSVKGVRRDLPTQFYIEPAMFDNRAGVVNKWHPSARAINLELKKLVVDYETRLIPVNISSWSAAKIADFLRAQDGADGRAFPFFAAVIRQKALTSTRNAELYEATLSKIKTFETNPDLQLKEITPAWLKRFDIFLTLQGNKINSRSIHFRILRAVYNAAIDEQIIDVGAYPFRRFKIKSGPTEKRALTLEQLRQLRDMKHTRAGVRFAASAFMLSFYLIGANGGDLYALKEISGGRAWYKRQKTSSTGGGVLSVKIEPEARAMIDRLSGEHQILCFADVFKSVRVMTSQLNSDLKRAGDKIGAPGLCMNAARHSWATLAATEIDPPASTEEIGRGLGHSQKGVTDIYILQNPKRTDAINRAVLDLLK